MVILSRVERRISSALTSAGDISPSIPSSIAAAPADGTMNGLELCKIGHFKLFPGGGGKPFWNIEDLMKALDYWQCQ